MREHSRHDHTMERADEAKIQAPEPVLYMNNRCRDDLRLLRGSRQDGHGKICCQMRIFETQNRFSRRLDSDMHQAMGNIVTDTIINYPRILFAAGLQAERLNENIPQKQQTFHPHRLICPKSDLYIIRSYCPARLDCAGKGIGMISGKVTLYKRVRRRRCSFYSHGFPVCPSLIILVSQNSLPWQMLWMIFMFTG